MSTNYQVESFYSFFTILSEDIPKIVSRLEHYGSLSGASGLVIVATEGVNGTLAGTEFAMSQRAALFGELFGEKEWNVKLSTAARNPYRRFKVKVREEIVTIGKDVGDVAGGAFGHLSPTEWHEVLSREEDFVLLDTRNKYETDLGAFNGALIPDFTAFTEFSEYVDSQNIPKDKKVLMYCTGGIRCEKAALEMKNKGYRNVFQLKGGILEYLAEYPDAHFDGECFVFDHRVSVDQQLQPSKRYILCPHCGDPGDYELSCLRCEKPAKICSNCAGQEDLNTCSKDCSYHFRLKQERASAVQ